MYTPKATKGSKFYYALIQKRNELKQKYTEAESLLWFELKQNKLSYSFRRQHIVNNFIVDFYCIQKALAIEVDGEIHKLQKIRDAERDSVLKILGIKTIRFTNNQIVNNMESCIDTIKTALSNGISSPPQSLGRG